MFSRQGPPVNQQNIQHPAAPIHQWYPSCHHQSGFNSGNVEETPTGWHHPIPSHIYPPSPDLSDYLQGNMMHGVNFNANMQGYAMMGPQHQRVPYSHMMEMAQHHGAFPDGPPVPPSPISGSDLSSPGVNGTSSPPVSLTNGNNTQVNRPPPARSPYEWIKKNSYQNQPNPGKTRTKDKYRVVYTDHQRVELEKEFYFSRYITIRKKTELAASLGLSERQVKIWFQNRRAKERKQNKKRQEMAHSAKEHIEASMELQQQQLMNHNVNHQALPIM